MRRPRTAVGVPTPRTSRACLRWARREKRSSREWQRRSPPTSRSCASAASSLPSRIRTPGASRPDFAGRSGSRRFPPAGPATADGREELSRAPYTEARVISTNQLKNGNHIEVDGTVFKVLEFQHVKPGKGGAFVRTKLRRASDGNVIDKTFRAGEKFRAVRTEARKMTFLYTDGTDAHFMDTESYEQMAVPEGAVAEALRWTKPNDPVDVLFIDGAPSDLQLP